MPNLFANFAVMERNVVIDGLNICYSETGNSQGVPIVLMHGWGCSHKTLESIENIVASGGMRVINIDFPGFGKSDEPKEVWGVMAYADLTEKLFDTLEIENPILLGHSFGGRVAIVIASRRQVRKIVLTDAAGVKPKHSLKWYLKVYSYKLVKKLYPIVYGKQRAMAKIEEARAKRGSSDYNNATPMMRAILSKCVNEDLCSLMPKIKAPTLLVWGENDTATPLSDARTMERLIPDAGLVSFPGCGHYSFLDNPYGYRAVLTEFLKNDFNVQSK